MSKKDAVNYRVLAISSAVLAIFVLSVASLFGFAWVFMWAWNFAVVAAFPFVRSVTYWQAFALLLVLMIVSRGVTWRFHSEKIDE